ncbi:probable NOT transcription complex subunit VIP2 isoform X1 [Zingiber officinale]|uniref:probable NOT transcription complex subunit VIP2 isoform X1 n=3 Tax=Zingiber officinale TaxID=94328 RepID=UPI001C4C4F8D|nr:probable NOT transcription complex subunit VIP2 isoform X1 [Zingiber officinale]
MQYLILDRIMRWIEEEETLQYLILDMDGGLQGLHNIHGSFNLSTVPGSLASREAAMGVVPSGGVQQPGGSIPSGRFSSNNLLVALSQMPHGSGVTNRGGINVVGNHAFSSSNINGVTGSIIGISSSSAYGNCSSIPGLGVSLVLSNVGPRLTSSVGNIVGSGNMGRSISSGGLSVPSLASRVNLATMHRARRIMLAPVRNIFVYYLLPFDVVRRIVMCNLWIPT